MTNEFSNESLQEFPTEVLIHIFSYSHPKQLCICRQVCRRWKDIIDTLFENEKVWHRICIDDFGDLAKNAFFIAGSQSWLNIYRSLTLWPKLPHSKESMDEFAATDAPQQIYGLQILPDGLIGVQNKYSIDYYDIDTLQPSKIPKVSGCYVKYMESYDVGVLLSIDLHLYIVRKFKAREYFLSHITFDYVIIFLLVERSVYYFSKNLNELVVVDLNDSHFSSKILAVIPDEVIALSMCNSQIYLLTNQSEICTIDKGKVCVVVNLELVDDPINFLRKYDLLHQPNQVVALQLMKLVGFKPHLVSEEYSRDITSVKTYGDIVFVGTKSVFLRIYHIKINEEFNLNKKPLKEYNFREPTDHCVHISHIDILEGDDSHKVFVALKRRVVVLNFSHDFSVVVPNLQK